MAVHKDADDRKGGEVGMMEGIDAGSGSDSGTTFVHEDASEVIGGLENEVNRVIGFGGVVSFSDSGTTSVYEHADKADLNQPSTSDTLGLAR
jgi:hypothetical protein